MFSTKEKVLTMLEKNRGVPVSGAAISKDLSVTRGAIWKAVEELRKEGHEILASPNKGYALSENSDLLSEEGILHHMQNPNIVRGRIFIHKSIGSTNQTAKKMAFEGIAHPFVVLAEEQTDGRGRLGRGFYSPEGSGLYLSILLRPDRTKESAILTTTAAAVAVCRSLKKKLSIDAQIKWVNDIYIRERKICGILTEAVNDFETGTIEALVLGIGINVKESEKGFPEEIKNKAGTLEESAGMNHISRNRLAASVIDEVLKINEHLNPEDFLKEYRSKCFILGKNIAVSRGDELYAAKAVDIGERGELIVKKQDGTFSILNSGEISIRPSAE